MTLELNTESKPSVAHTEVEPEQPSLFSEEEIRTFATNVFKIYEKTMTNSERLSALAQIDPEQYNEEVDALTEEFLDEDPGFQEVMTKFKKARLNDAGDPFVPEIKARRAEARELITKPLNIPENSIVNGIEGSKEHIADLLKDVPKERQNANLALSILGAKVEVENTPGEYVYSFPYDLFPEEVNNKWADYLESVKAHIYAADNITPETRDSVNTADRFRKYAHDSITKTVHSLLQLDQFGVTEKETREVIAKMRNDELMLAREPHKSIHKKTPEELAVAKQLARRKFDH